MTKKKAPEQLTGEEILTRQAIGWNAIGNLPNPNFILRRMGRVSDTHRNLSKDAHLAGEERKRLGAVRNCPWTLSEGPDGPRKEISDALWKLDVRDIVTQAMKATARGVAVLEVLWEYNGGRVWPSKIIGKPMDSFAFRFSDNALMMITRDAPMGVPVQPYRFLLVQNEPEFDNPYGDGYLDKCFWPVTFKRGGVKFWMRFVEKYAGVFAVGKYPRNSPPADKEEFLDSLYSMIQDACAVIPEDGSVQLIEAAQKGASADIYEKLCNWADKQISKAILGQTLTADIGENGSRAAAQTHYQVGQDVAKDDATLVHGVMNQLVGWMWDLNFGTPDRPWWSLVAPQDLKEDLATRDLKLTQSGARFTPQYFIEAYGFSPAHLSKEPAPPQGSPLNLAAGEPSGGLTDVDAGAIQLASQAAKTELFSPIRTLVEMATSLEEVRDKLLETYDNVDVEAIAPEMEQAFLAANLKGRFEIMQKAGLL